MGILLSALAFLWSALALGQSAGASRTPFLSVVNSTTTPLGASATWTGEWEQCFHWSTISTAATTDLDGTLKIQFSPDASNVDSSLSFDLKAGVIEPPHKLEIFRRYCRVQFTNDSTTTTQTYLRIQTIYGLKSVPVSPLNLPINPDADASIVRNIDTEFSIGTGLFTGVTKVLKFGENTDVDTGAAEDIWDGGGLYTGFPTETELVEVLSSSANDDEGGSGCEKIHIFGLDANKELQDEEITLNGTAAVDSANTYTRVFRAICTQSNNGANDAFNAGAITIRHTTTTANVFSVVPAGANQSRVCAYTIPSDKTGFLRDWHVSVDKSNSANLSGELYLKEPNTPPRYIRHWQASDSNNFDQYIYSAITLASGSDIVVRVTSSSGNNVDAMCSMDIFLIDNI